MATTHHKLPADFKKKGRPVHVSIDNSDGKQQTLTGAHTTHYTNGTVFQLDTEDPTPECRTKTTEVVAQYLEQELDAEEDFGNYSIKK